MPFKSKTMSRPHPLHRVNTPARGLWKKNSLQAQAKHLLLIICANAKGKENLKGRSKQAILLVERKIPVHVCETKR